jgi:hypothetical protein
MAVVVVVLLVSGYVSAWVLYPRWGTVGGLLRPGPFRASPVQYKGILTFDGSLVIHANSHPAFAPILEYIEAGHPGARLLEQMWWTVNV